ncbi:thermonuclease family protein [Microcoleus sp. AT9b-C3]|uniref:thermonuclease family protein n=1 Tax=Microcoleus sp. AT9b-C3 TaxID=2818629 RepID=UPI002FCFA101
MQKFLNALPLLAIAVLVWFHFHQPNDKPKLAKPPSQTESRRCQVVEGSIYDGDTFRVRCDNQEQKIRLCGIDAPEAKQPLGIESRNYLRSLVAQAKGQVIVIEMDRDKYGRSVAEVLLESPSGEQSVQEEMLKAGMAYHYKQFSANCHNTDVFDTAEEMGRSTRRGVWRLPNGGERPWDYRKQNKS